jgi:hypothetical protein
MVLLPEGLKALKRVAKEVGLDLKGAYLNLDGGFDSAHNRKLIFNAGMIPNIKENPRNRKGRKRGRRRLFNAGSCPSSVRVNTRGLPGGRHKVKKFYTRESSWYPSGPRTPGDPLDAGRADARRLRRLPPRAASHPSACSHPRWLWPRRHPIQQDLSQAPDMIGQPGGHRWRRRAPLLRGARAIGGQGLGEGLV